MLLKCVWETLAKREKFPCMWTLFLQWKPWNFSSNLTAFLVWEGLWPQMARPLSRFGSLFAVLQDFLGPYCFALRTKGRHRIGSQHHKYYRVARLFCTFIIGFVSYPFCHQHLFFLNPKFIWHTKSVFIGRHSFLSASLVNAVCGFLYQSYNDIFTVLLWKVLCSFFVSFKKWLF